MTEAPAEYVAVLAKVPLFSSLSEPDAATLAAKGQRRSYAAGEIIFQQYDEGDVLHIVLDGLVKLYLPSDDGSEAVLILLKAGEIFGELSLFDGAPRSASASAMEPTITLTIDRGNFLDFLRDHPEASLNIFAVLARRLRRTNDVIADTAFLDIHTRVAKKLLELAENFGRTEDGEVHIDLGLTQQDFASMVSATRESVNRVLVALEAQGVIRIARKSITIVRIDVLGPPY